MDSSRPIAPRARSATATSPNTKDDSPKPSSTKPNETKGAADTLLHIVAIAKHFVTTAAQAPRKVVSDGSKRKPQSFTAKPKSSWTSIQTKPKSSCDKSSLSYHLLIPSTEKPNQNCKSSPLDPSTHTKSCCCPWQKETQINPSETNTDTLYEREATPHQRAHSAN